MLLRTFTEKNNREVELKSEAIEYVVSGNGCSYVYFKNSKMMKVKSAFTEFHNLFDCEEYELYRLPNKKEALIPVSRVAYMIDEESKYSYIHFMNSDQSLRVVGGLNEHDLEGAF